MSLLNKEERAIKEAAKNATKGKWVFDRDGWDENVKRFAGITIERYQPNEDYIKPIIQTDDNFYGPSYNDALHILASQPQAILRVLDRLEDALNTIATNSYTG